MAIVEFNSVLKSTVINKLQKTPSGVFGLDIKLYSSENNNKDHIVTPLYIDNYIIMQDFTKVYTDVVYLVFKVQLDDFLKIYENYKNLYCTLLSYPVPESTRYPKRDMTKEEVDNSILENDLSDNINNEGWVHTYRAVILNIEDIQKQININEIKPNEEKTNETDTLHAVTLDVKLQLMKEDIYQIRTGSFNALFKNCTVKQAIYAAANMLNISNISLIEPDNQTVQRQIIFPPMQTLESFIPLLQKDPGIYKEGCEYYFTNGTLYIYPGYKADPERDDPIINIYKIPDNYFVGLFGYHSLDEDKNIHIVVDKVVKAEDKANESLENTGNRVVTLNTDKTFDLNRQVSPNNSTHTSNNLLSVSMTNVEGNTTNKYNTKYVKGSANAYIMASDMIKDNRIDIQVGWHNPIPYLVSPGQRCIYHYEDSEGYKTRCGIVESVFYDFVPVSVQSEYIYKGEAIISLRLASDSENLISTNDTSNSSSSDSIFDYISSNLGIDKISSWF